MFAAELKLWHMHDDSPLLVHNPWARTPLNPDLIPLRQLVWDVGDGHFKERVGRNIAEILNLPNPWPIKTWFQYIRALCFTTM